MSRWKRDPRESREKSCHVIPNSVSTNSEQISGEAHFVQDAVTIRNVAAVNMVITLGMAPNQEPSRRRLCAALLSCSLLALLRRSQGTLVELDGLSVFVRAVVERNQITPS